MEVHPRSSGQHTHHYIIRSIARVLVTCCKHARQAKRCTAWCVRMASIAEVGAPACQPFIKSGSVAMAQPLCAILLM